MELLDDFPVFESKDESEYPEEVILDVLGPREKIIDRAGIEYDFVGKYLEDNDFYQGLNMVSVIRNKETGKKYGYFWWDDISKYGESFVEPNGEEFGLECDTDAPDFDWDRDYVSYYVWVPVTPISIQGYGRVQATA